MTEIIFQLLLKRLNQATSCHNSIIFMIEAQADYIVNCVKLLQAKGNGYLDVKEEAQNRFLGEMTQALKGTVWDSGCKSWYQTAEGINFAIWPKSTWRYWLATRKVNEADYRFVKCVGQSNQDTARVPGGQAMAQTAAR